ncbi:MAG: hypothetical protein J7M14_00020 [Planctomycetes bacterium]|nr:hypothetical protein [Planctomycetota bacterium]
MVCDNCGAVFERIYLGELLVRTAGSVRHVAWDDCKPAEYVTVCPVCGWKESFEPAAKR